MSIHKQIFLGFAIAPVAVRCEALCITITLKRELSGEIGSFIWGIRSRE